MAALIHLQGALSPYKCHKELNIFDTLYLQYITGWLDEVVALGADKDRWCWNREQHASLNKNQN